MVKRLTRGELPLSSPFVRQARLSAGFFSSVFSVKADGKEQELALNWRQFLTLGILYLYGTPMVKMIVVFAIIYGTAFYVAGAFETPQEIHHVR